MPADPPELSPGVADLAPLLGTWVGTGTGEYPTIAPFRYREEVTVGHIGKPFLTYAQRTRSEDDGRPLHAETGYIRMATHGRVELVLAHPTGITEIDEGPLDARDGRLVLDLHSATVGLSATAKDVTAVRRSITVTGDELHYTLQMAAVGQPLVNHLTATLHRRP